MNLEEHWENVYRTKSPADTSWYAPHLADSLRAIEVTGIAKTAAILDVGAGESTLLEDLLRLGFTDLTATDISATALEKMRERLGHRGDELQWIVGDITTVALPARRYDLWHDRAIFHFLAQREQRQRYVAQVKHALRPNGSVILSTFGPDGPTRCSGLDVCRMVKQRWPDIVVIQVSASFISSADRVVGLDNGADCYLTAPLEPAVVIRMASMAPAYAGAPLSRLAACRTAPTASARSSARRPTASTRPSATASSVPARPCVTSTGSRSPRSVARSRTAPSSTSRWG